jgi:hypothetical protein
LVLKKTLNILIGSLTVLTIILSVQLVCLFFQPDESLAQDQTMSSHPLVDGQQLPDMPDAGCLTCHQDLP